MFSSRSMCHPTRREWREATRQPRRTSSCSMSWRSSRRVTKMTSHVKMRSQITSQTKILRKIQCSFLRFLDSILIIAQRRWRREERARMPIPLSTPSNSNQLWHPCRHQWRIQCTHPTRAPKSSASSRRSQRPDPQKARKTTTLANRRWIWTRAC